MSRPARTIDHISQGDNVTAATIIAFCKEAIEAHASKLEANSAYNDVLGRAKKAGVNPAHIKRYIKESKQDRAQLDLFEAEYSRLCTVMKVETTQTFRAVE